jgi:transposase
MAMKRYEQNFKNEALKLSDDIGVKKACEQLNLNYGTLTGWRKQRVKKNKEENKSGNEIQIENTRLIKEIEELKSANEILKDALGFFAQDRKK